MSSARDLLVRLAYLDIRLEVEGDQLKVNAPTGAMSPELRHEVVALKPQLLAELAGSAGRIPRVPTATAVPLTSGQQRLWELTRLHGETGVYNVPLVFALRGALDVAALARSLIDIERRHEVLRATIRSTEDGPRLYVDDDAHAPLELIDLASVDAAERNRAVDDALGDAIRRPFDLGRAPLWRCSVLRRADDDHVLVLTVHHIVFDRASKTVLLRELEALYSGADLPPLDVRYRDYAHWHHGETQRRRRAEQTEFLTQQLDGSVRELLLPTDHPRSTSTVQEGSSETFEIPAELSAELRMLGASCGSTMYMTLLAAFHVLLHRYTGQTDQIVCSPVSGRPSAQLETLIGYFNNIVPMRGDLSGDPTFRELLARVRRESSSALLHQDAPFQEIASHPSCATTPLTRALFNYRSTDSTSLDLPGVVATPVESRRQHADFDLAMYVGIERGRLTGVVDYNAGLFDASTVGALVDNFATILGSVVADPDRPLSQLPWIGTRFDAVEASLTARSSVDDAVVVVRSDARGTSNLAVYVVANEHDVPSRDELRDAVIQLLPDRGDVTLVSLDQIPRLVNGAVDLNALPTPTLTRPPTAPEYSPPRTPLEERLAAIWQRVLWRDEPVGIHDDFFDLGGHSLLSVQLLAETEHDLQRTVPVASLGQLSTIADFAAMLDDVGEAPRSDHADGVSQAHRDQLRAYTAAWNGARVTSDSLIVGLHTDGTLQPVFWCIQRFLNLSEFARHFGPDQPVYGMRSGHNVLEQTPDNIRALAHVYADEILAVQPAGPYIVGGICQGAEIAIDVALRLLELGHDVNLLGLQDRFVPKEYPGRVALFFGDRSNRSPYHEFATPELGWRKYYTGPIDTHIVHGAHGTYFQERNITSLTDAMAAAFATARSAAVPSPGGPTLQRLDPSAYRADIAVTASSCGPDAATLHVSAVNTSAVTWPATERSGIMVGARWVNTTTPSWLGSKKRWLASKLSRGRPSLPARDEWFTRYLHANEARADIPVDVPPGARLECELVVPLPADGNLTTVDVDMVDEGVTWFGDAGSDAARLRLR